MADTVSPPVDLRPEPSWLTAAHAGCLVVAAAIYAVTSGWYVFQPLLDEHAWRQAQTAMSAEYLSRDLHPAAMLRYETPVFGHPWRAPFEFPLFQWLAAVVRRMSGLPAGTACKLVACAFHLATLWPVWRIVRMLGAGLREWCGFSALFLLAPVLHHWSRAALIESTAVYLAVESLAALLAWAVHGRMRSLVAASLFLPAAMLVKVTTVPPFLALGLGGVVLWAGDRIRRGSPPGPQARRVAAALIPVLIGTALFVPWMRVCDAVKHENPIASHTTSAALTGWNYGSLADRFSLRLWRDTVLRRAIPEAVGWPGAALVLVGLVRGPPTFVGTRAWRRPRFCGSSRGPGSRSSTWAVGGLRRSRSMPTGARSTFPSGSRSRR